ncbi:MAG: adenylate/guanylate cyclase domain-containing protein [Chloroflexi bacterium]|nr:adenylate/guanylate cyclase domain-containing protein [Chloroflexota bacterium]
MAQNVQPIRTEAAADLGVAPEQLWPLVADTGRLNEAVGLPPVHFRAIPRPDGGAQIVGEYRLLGVPFLRWLEHPFRWDRARRYSVERDYDWGPIRRFHGGTDLSPSAGGSRVVVWVELTPRSVFGAALARWLLGPRSVRSALRQYRRFDRYLQGKASDPFPHLKRSGAAVARIGALCAGLVSAGHDAGIVQRLGRHLAEAHDDEIVHMRPFELADRWAADRRQTLVAFLQATTAGLLRMTWEVLCPTCRVAKVEHASLRDLAAHAHCDVCNRTFDVDFDRLVEVRFHPAPGIRRVDLDEYCAGGPMNAPHRVGQVELLPGETQTLQLTLHPGVYWLHSPQAHGLLDLRVTGAAGGSMVDVDLLPLAVEPGEATVAAGDVSLRIANRLESPALVGVDRSEWAATAATAALVSTIQEFRDLFSSEVLSPDVQLAIQSLAFLFTDIMGSTALYQQLGEARAFRLVQDHFRILRDAIQRHEGAVVKTIGDAVMAVFPAAGAAVAAALDVQRDIRALDSGGAVDPAGLVKVGLHQGPCYAVTLNGRLDYFGTTVNVAARAQHESKGGQIVVTEAAYADPEARRLLAQAAVPIEPFEVRLRGIAEPHRLHRITAR